MATAARLQKYYIAYYGRPGDTAGLDYWSGVSGQEINLVHNFGSVLQTEFVNLYGADTDAATFVNAVYNNLFGRDADTAGLNYWIGVFNQKSRAGESPDAIRAQMVIWVLDGAVGDDAAVINAKLTAAQAWTAALDTSDEVAAYGNVNNVAGQGVAREWLADVVSAATATSQTAAGVLNGAISEVVAYAVNATAKILTSETDTLSGQSFYAGLVYTPGGNDRVNSLQDEDSLVGVGSHAVLNAVLGVPNDNGDSIVTPVLQNIETVNVQFTGQAGAGSSTLSLRDAEGTENVNITRIVGDVRTVSVKNMSDEVTSLGVANSDLDPAVEFNYREGELGGGSDAVTLTLNNVRARDLSITYGDVYTDNDERENIETVSVVTTGAASNIESLSIADDEKVATTQTLNITAGQALELNSLNADGVTALNIAANAAVELTYNTDGNVDLDAGNEALNTESLRTLTITGAGNVTLNGIEGDTEGTYRTSGTDANSGVTVTATGMTGNLSAVFTAIGEDAESSIATGSGNDTLITRYHLSADVSTNNGNDSLTILGHVNSDASISLGAGNDTLTVGSSGNGQYITASVAGSLNAGSGTDTVVLYADGTSTLNAMSGVETFRSINADSDDLIVQAGDVATTFEFVDANNATATMAFANADTAADTLNLVLDYAELDLHLNASGDALERLSLTATDLAQLSLAGGDELNRLTVGGTGEAWVDIESSADALTVNAANLVGNLQLTFDGINTFGDEDTITGSTTGGFDVVIANIDGLEIDGELTPDLTNVEVLGLTVVNQDTTIDLSETTGLQWFAYGAGYGNVFVEAAPLLDSFASIELDNAQSSLERVSIWEDYDTIGTEDFLRVNYENGANGDLIIEFGEIDLMGGANTLDEVTISGDESLMITAGNGFVAYGNADVEITDLTTDASVNLAFDASWNQMSLITGSDLSVTYVNRVFDDNYGGSGGWKLDEVNLTGELSASATGNSDVDATLSSLSAGSIVVSAATQSTALLNIENIDWDQDYSGLDFGDVSITASNGLVADRSDATLSFSYEGLSDTLGTVTVGDVNLTAVGNYADAVFAAGGYGDSSTFGDTDDITVGNITLTTSAGTNGSSTLDFEFNTFGAGANDTITEDVTFGDITFAMATAADATVSYYGAHNPGINVGNFTFGDITGDVNGNVDVSIDVYASSFITMGDITSGNVDLTLVAGSSVTVEQLTELNNSMETVDSTMGDSVLGDITLDMGVNTEAYIGNEIWTEGGWSGSASGMTVGDAIIGDIDVTLASSASGSIYSWLGDYDYGQGNIFGDLIVGNVDLTTYAGADFELDADLVAGDSSVIGNLSFGNLTADLIEDAVVITVSATAYDSGNTGQATLGDVNVGNITIDGSIAVDSSDPDDLADTTRPVNGVDFDLTATTYTSENSAIAGDVTTGSIFVNAGDDSDVNIYVGNQASGDNSYVGDLTTSTVDVTMGDDSLFAMRVRSGEDDGAQNVTAGNVTLADIDVTLGDNTSRSSDYTAVNINIEMDNESGDSGILGDLTVGNIDITVGDGIAADGGSGGADMQVRVDLDFDTGSGGSLGGDVTTGNISIVGGDDVDAYVTLSTEVEEGTLGDVNFGPISITLGDDSDVVGTADVSLETDVEESATAGNISYEDISITVGDGHTVDLDADVNTWSGSSFGELTIGNVTISAGDDAYYSGGELGLEAYGSGSTAGNVTVGDISLTFGDDLVNPEFSGAIFEIEAIASGASGEVSLGDFTIGNITVDLGTDSEFDVEIAHGSYSGDDMTIGSLTVGSVGVTLASGAAFDLSIEQEVNESSTSQDMTVGSITVSGADASADIFIQSSGSAGSTLGNLSVADITVTNSNSEYATSYANVEVRQDLYSVFDTTTTAGNFVVGNIEVTNENYGSGDIHVGRIIDMNDAEDSIVEAGDFTVGDVSVEAGLADDGTSGDAYVTVENIVQNGTDDISTRTTTVGNISAIATDDAYAFIEVGDEASGFDYVTDIGVTSIGDITVTASGSGDIDIIVNGDDVDEVTIGNITVTAENISGGSESYLDYNYGPNTTEGLLIQSVGDLREVLVGDITLDASNVVNFDAKVIGGDEVDDIEFGNISVSGNSGSANFSVRSEDIDDVLFGDLTVTQVSGGSNSLAVEIFVSGMGSGSGSDVGDIEVGDISVSTSVDGSSVSGGLYVAENYSGSGDIYGDITVGNISLTVSYDGVGTSASGDVYVEVWEGSGSGFGTTFGDLEVGEVTANVTGDGVSSSGDSEIRISMDSYGYYSGNMSAGNITVGNVDLTVDDAGLTTVINGEWSTDSQSIDVGNVTIDLSNDVDVDLHVCQSGYGVASGSYDVAVGDVTVTYISGDGDVDLALNFHQYTSGDSSGDAATTLTVGDVAIDVTDVDNTNTVLIDMNYEVSGASSNSGGTDSLTVGNITINTALYVPVSGDHAVSGDWTVSGGSSGDMIIGNVTLTGDAEFDLNFYGSGSGDTIGDFDASAVSTDITIDLSTFEGRTDGSDSGATYDILGGSGDDTISGSQASDYIVGNTGTDDMWGMSGDDTFAFTSGDNDGITIDWDAESAGDFYGLDTIHDFSNDSASGGSGDDDKLVFFNALADDPSVTQLDDATFDNFESGGNFYDDTADLVFIEESGGGIGWDYDIYNQNYSLEDAYSNFLSAANAALSETVHYFFGTIDSDIGMYEGNTQTDWGNDNAQSINYEENGYNSGDTGLLAISFGGSGQVDMVIKLVGVTDVNEVFSALRGQGYFNEVL